MRIFVKALPLQRCVATFIIILMEYNFAGTNKQIKSDFQFTGQVMENHPEYSLCILYIVDLTILYLLHYSTY